MEKGLLIELLINIIADLLACAELYLFMNKILLMKADKRVYRWIIAGGIVVGGNVILAYCSDNVFLYFIFLIVKGLISGFLCINENIKARITKSLFTYFGLGVVWVWTSFLVAIFEKIFNFSVENNGIRIIRGIADVAFILLFSVVINLRKEYVIWISRIKLVYYWLWTICFIIYCFANALLEAYIDEYQSEFILIIKGTQIGFSCILGFMCCVSLIIDGFNVRYKKENELKDIYLKLSQEHYQDLENHIKAIRKLKHDMNSHLCALEQLVQNGETERAREYINEIRGYCISLNRKMIFTGNDLVDAVLISYYDNIEDLEVNCVGNIGETNIKEYDLCTIFSNIFKNAVEAVKKLEYKKKYIDINIKHYENYLLIEIKNPIENEIDVEHLGCYTTKSDKDKHGYGISNVRDTVKKYNGEICFDVVNELFRARIQIEK